MVMEVVTAEVMVEEVQVIQEAEAEADGRLAVAVDSIEGEVVEQDLTIARDEGARVEEAQAVQVQVGGVNSCEKTNTSVAQGRNNPTIRSEEVKREAGAEVMGSKRVNELNTRIEEKKTSKVQEVTQCSVLATDDMKRRRINSGRRKSQRSKQTYAEKIQLASLSVVSMIEKKSEAEVGQSHQIT